MVTLKPNKPALPTGPMSSSQTFAIASSFTSDDRAEAFAADELPWADRRLDERFPVRPGASVEVRRWGIGVGNDLAVQLLDVSASGVGVQLKRLVRSGEQLDVTLWVPKRTWCIRCKSVVRWCILGPDGNALTGLQLSRPLLAQDFEALVNRS